MKTKELKPQRFLITTALEETWPADDVPVLFLGEWCRLYERKEAWENKDAIVAEYHWNNREKFYKDSCYLKKVYEELLQEVAEQLNSRHGTQHSLRYWRVILGPWLIAFIQILFDRWEMLTHVIAQNSITEARVLRRNSDFLVPNDMSEFGRLYVEDAWNEMIYGKILDWLQFPAIKIDVFDKAEPNRFGSKSKRTRGRIKRYLVDWASRCLAVFSKHDPYFFISSYLDIKQDLLLQAKIGQLPKIWRSIPVPKVKFNQSIRQWKMQHRNKERDFSSLVREFIPLHIPIAYLEGYQNVVSLTKKLRWPQRPKVIFTSNSEHGDDVFKFWAAEKIENGSGLVIGQHGGCYGMLRWSSFEELEVSIADRFLTWGWSEPTHNNVVPVGILKTFGSRKVRCNQKGVALLVQLSHPRLSLNVDCVPVSAEQWLSYFEDQCRFVKALPTHVIKDLLIRVHQEDYKYDQKMRWRDKFPDVKFDNEKLPMLSNLKNLRVFIGTYNGTIYLETLSLNFPTIMFWNPVHWELREGVQPYFDLLTEVGIFHTTPESAARHLMKVWDDVDRWWADDKTQNAREQFCREYARLPKKPLNDLALTLREIAIKAQC